MTQDELIKFLKSPENGYFNVRIIDGRIIANLQMLFTTALCLDLDEWGFKKRYCYESRYLGQKACKELKHPDDEPLEGYVAIKPDYYDPKKTINQQ